MTTFCLLSRCRDAVATPRVVRAGVATLLGTLWLTSAHADPAPLVVPGSASLGPAREALAASLARWIDFKTASNDTYRYEVPTDPIAYLMIRGKTTIYVRDGIVVGRVYEETVPGWLQRPGGPQAPSRQGFREEEGEIGTHSYGATPRTLDEVYAAATSLLAGTLEPFEQLYLSFDDAGLLRNCFTDDVRIADEPIRRGVHLDNITALPEDFVIPWPERARLLGTKASLDHRRGGRYSLEFSATVPSGGWSMGPAVINRRFCSRGACFSRAVEVPLTAPPAGLIVPQMVVRFERRETLRLPRHQETVDVIFLVDGEIDRILAIAVPPRAEKQPPRGSWLDQRIREARKRTMRLNAASRPGGSNAG